MRALSRLTALLLLASATASAGTVYKWKDANGVTQYSEKPPAGHKYEAREVQARDPVPRETAAAPAENKACTDARGNLTLLNGSGKVMQDTDGDGKADTALTEAQRSAQKTLAEAAIQAYCTPKA
ncbi:DUF4124 domain-containing protein [Stenotrophomonas rhizophila]|uniref:DUF4124 domain-containing protein n=1 Tax=Stenotrophomonas rhizophila TaxID=216778 RepID=A0AAW5PNE0_9GAMM|nr:DUF4124 domain-containing protein [Stenotrophomonas rhizophila]MCS4281256.1 hypothetical protein [Stenotrophomonas rhizophila]